MKRGVLSILLMLIFAFNFVVASVTVNNYTITKSYAPFANITGEINLTIEGEDFDELVTSNDGDEIMLGEFLNRSGNLFKCSPPDCSSDYIASVGVSDKTFIVPSSGNVYVGFVLDGEIIEVTDLDFEIESDFVASAKRPISIKFFESETWKYEEFSDEFLSKDYGCFDHTAGTEGPLIGTVRYCEMIDIPDSDMIRVGGVISGTDTVGVNMTIYPDTGIGGAEGSCDFDPSNDEDGCIIYPDQDSIFSGKYQVCVNADRTTTYHIDDESVGSTCGFIYDKDPSSSIKDYGIYAQGVKYADNSMLVDVDVSNQDIVDAANAIIQDRYEGDCSSGCVLPLAISGVSQNARIYDIKLSYTNNSEVGLENKIYDLEATSVTLDFDSTINGVLDLAALGFTVSKTMKYILHLGNEKLFSEEIDILPAPIITGVVPLDPPAGVPIKFFAKVNYSKNISLTYKWDFGDGTTETKGVSYIMHTYPDLGNYTLTLEVSAGGNLTSTKSFTINTISPEDAVNITLGLKRESLNSVIASIAEVPTWYSGALSKLINVAFFEGELDRLDRLMINALGGSAFVEIAEEAYALDIPTILSHDSFDSDYFITNLEDVEIEPVGIIGGSITGATNDLYAKPILNWQIANIDVKVALKNFLISTYSVDSESILSVYSYTVKNKDTQESYFVINRPFSQLFFKEAVGARKAGDATVIVLPAGGQTSFEFYYEGGDSVSVFVSPRLSSIVVVESIDTTCNFNLVCEPDFGENPSTCRSDCKPIKGAIIYVILAFVFVLILYTGLQIWYKRRYENYLFKDRRQAYNLLMYVTNARARGMTDNRLAAELRSQGWSSERVTYIVKKSVGQRTGLYEIIPIGKIMAYFRLQQAKKSQVGKVATNPQQQMGRNINKSRFPRRV